MFSSIYQNNGFYTHTKLILAATIIAVLAPVSALATNHLPIEASATLQENDAGREIIVITWDPSHPAFNGLSVLEMNISTIDGTAHAGHDYDAINSEFRAFAINDGIATILAPLIHEDGVDFEPNETLTLSLTNPTTNEEIGIIHLRIETVPSDFFDQFDPELLALAETLCGGPIDPDSAESFYCLMDFVGNNIAGAGVFPDASVEEHVGNASLLLTWDPSSTSFLDEVDTFGLRFSTSDGSAVAGDDYTDTSGTALVRIADGSYAINVPIIDDTDQEADETLTATIEKLNGATAATATVTINQNDGPVPVQINDTTVPEVDGSPVLILTWDPSDPAFDDISVLRIDYFTTDGTATNGDDYTSTPGFKEFAVEDGIGTIAIFTVIDDSEVEGDENFTITLTDINAGGATINTATVTIEDNDTEEEKTVEPELQEHLTRQMKHHFKHRIHKWNYKIKRLEKKIAQLNRKAQKAEEKGKTEKAEDLRAKARDAQDRIEILEDMIVVLEVSLGKTVPVVVPVEFQENLLPKSVRTIEKQMTRWEKRIEKLLERAQRPRTNSDALQDKAEVFEDLIEVLECAIEE